MGDINIWAENNDFHDESSIVREVHQSDSGSSDAERLAELLPAALKRAAESGNKELLSSLQTLQKETQTGRVQALGAAAKKFMNKFAPEVLAGALGTALLALLKKLAGL